SYQPAIAALGFQYKTDKWRVGASVEHQAWSDLGDEMKKDTLADQAAVKEGNREGVEFRDIVVPRIGADFNVTEHISVTGGLAFSSTPLSSCESLAMTVLVADKTILGLGLSADASTARFFTSAVRVALGSQYQKIDKEEYTLFSTR